MFEKLHLNCAFRSYRKCPNTIKSADSLPTPMSMIHIQFSVAICLLAVLCAFNCHTVHALTAAKPTTTAEPYENQRPNIIFHVIDDFGFDDAGFRNDNQIKTPNLNLFHTKGVTLDNYYVQPSCSPTRATIMTGRYPLHTGINNWIPNVAYGVPMNETLLPELLARAGYHCHGKNDINIVTM